MGSADNNYDYEDVEEDVDGVEVQDESLAMDVTDEIFSSIVEAEGFDETTLDEALDNLDDNNDSENADMSITSCFVPVEETPLVVAAPEVLVPKEATEVPMDAAEAEEEDWYDEECEYLYENWYEWEREEEATEG